MLAGLLITYCIQSLQIVVQEGQVRPIRLLLTGQPPELSRADGQRFDLFISRESQPLVEPNYSRQKEKALPHTLHTCCNTQLALPQNHVRSRRVVYRPGCGRHHVSSVGFESIHHRATLYREPTSQKL
jgi:hypothetical protein